MRWFNFHYIQTRTFVRKFLAKIICISPTSCRKKPPRCTKEAISKHAQPTTVNIGADESRLAASTSACHGDLESRPAAVDDGSGAISEQTFQREQHVDTVSTKDDSDEIDDWKFLALVLDRLFLWLFLIRLVFINYVAFQTIDFLFPEISRWSTGWQANFQRIFNRQQVYYVAQW